MTTTTIKTILTLESVLQRVKEIGIAARHETYAAIADRIFLTPACIEEIRNAMRLAPVSEDIRAEMLQLPAEVEAKRAREYHTNDKSWADVVASRVLGFQAELQSYQFLIVKKLIMPVIKPAPLEVCEKYYVRGLGELWGEVVDIRNDEVLVKMLFEHSTKCSVYEMRLWLGDGTLAKVSPELYEILLDVGMFLYADTVVFSADCVTAYWNRGHEGIGTKDIPYDQIVSISRDDVKIFPQKGDIPLIEKNKQTRADKGLDAQKLALRLAEQGIYAMYGGCKGHGFWLYRVGVEMAKTLVNQFDPEKFWDLAGSFEQTPIIKNDGKRSGNPCFWMFDDALKLAEVSVLEG